MLNSKLDADVLTNVLEVWQYLPILTINYAFFACQNEGKCEEVCVEGTIFIWEYGFPNAQGLEHLKLLREEKSDPAKTIVEWVNL